MEILNTEQVEKFKGEGSAIEQQAKALQVVDESTRAESSDIQLQAGKFKKTVEEKFSPAREAAHKAHTEICALINELVGPADRIIKLLKKKNSDYLLEEDRKHAAAQAIIDAETKRKEDAEKDRLLKLAVKQSENGNTAKAEETLQKAEEVKFFSPTLPSLNSQVKTASGSTSSRKDFTVTIINAFTVIKEIATGKLPVGIPVLDLKKNEIRITASSIKDYAKLQRVGDKLPDIPGCKLEWGYVESGRAAK